MIESLLAAVPAFAPSTFRRSSELDELSRLARTVGADEDHSDLDRVCAVLGQPAVARPRLRVV